MKGNNTQIHFFFTLSSLSEQQNISPVHLVSNIQHAARAASSRRSWHHRFRLTFKTYNLIFWAWDFLKKKMFLHHLEKKKVSKNDGAYFHLGVTITTSIFPARIVSYEMSVMWQLHMKVCLRFYSWKPHMIQGEASHFSPWFQPPHPLCVKFGKSCERYIRLITFSPSIPPYWSHILKWSLWRWIYFTLVP